MLLRSMILRATLVAAAAALAQSPRAQPAAPDRDRRVMLNGDASAAPAEASDEGPLAPQTPLAHVQILLRRPATLQAALDGLEAEQRRPDSPRYRQWLTPADLPSYGPPADRVARVTAWLAGNGLRVNQVSPSRMVVDASGTAAQLAATFRTELHRFRLHDEAHIANVGAPSVPAALAGIVAGVTLHDFFPRPALAAGGIARRDDATGKWVRVGPKPDFTFPFIPIVPGDPDLFLLTPGDISIIYDIGPARWGTGLLGQLTGAGQTVAVLDDSTFRAKDWDRYRAAFGLSAYPGTLTLEHPHCQDPGINGNVLESALDAELVTAVAPAAHVIQASCPTTPGALVFGVLTALQNMVELGTTAQVINVSYGGCERFQPPTEQLQWLNVVEEAAVEGLSIFVASGDNGPAGCDSANGRFDRPAHFGLAVNGLATPPYVTAVGGTDFEEVAEGTQAQYWLSSNRADGSSALSYVPETPWDVSCAGGLLDHYLHTDPLTFCNEPHRFRGTEAAGGGPSAVFGKPDWQSLDVTGVPDDGARDTPDVSMFAGSRFGQVYLVCQSDAAYGGAPCDFAKRHDVLANLVGGTSASTPLFAGIAALVAERRANTTHYPPPVRIGNMAPRLYQLAAEDFATGPQLSQCDARLGNRIGSACVFHNVTQYDIAVPCVVGTAHCYGDARSTHGVGVVATRPGSSTPAFQAHPGYSLATGLGSVDVTNLIAAY